MLFSPKHYKCSSLKFKRKSLCLHLPSLQPYNNKLGLLKLVVKTSLVELQFSQYSARTWLFKMYPLLSSTLQDLSLKELGIKKKNTPIKQSFVTRVNAVAVRKCTLSFKWICDCDTTATFQNNMCIAMIVYNNLFCSYSLAFAIEPKPKNGYLKAKQSS